MTVENTPAFNQYNALLQVNSFDEEESLEHRVTLATGHLISRFPDGDPLTAQDSYQRSFSVLNAQPNDAFMDLLDIPGIFSDFERETTIANPTTQANRAAVSYPHPPLVFPPALQITASSETPEYQNEASPVRVPQTVLDDEKELTQIPNAHLSKKAKKSAYDKAYYQAHKEKKAARDKAYAAAHKEQKAARNKAYYQAHKEKKAAYYKAYAAAHKEQQAACNKAYYQKLKLLKKGATQASTGVTDNTPLKKRKTANK